MKKQLSSVLKEMLISGLSFLIISPVTAQKEKEKEEPTITQEHLNKINEIVKPLRDQFEKQLNQDITYLAYLDGVKRIAEAKSKEEKMTMTSKLESKYSGFFQKKWLAAKVDEKGYQQRIRGVFPAGLAGLIKFDIFLNFSLVVSNFMTLPPPPLPPDICLDICPIAPGSIAGEGVGIGSANGSYGNCYLKVNSWAGVAGMAEVHGFLRNGITIPGTLPVDTRNLRVKKSYNLKQSATSFAFSGVGMSTAILVTYQSDELLYVFAPLLWMNSKTVNKTINEEYTLEKKEVAKSVFYVKAYGSSAVGSGSWCSTECDGIKWSICEEK